MKCKNKQPKVGIGFEDDDVECCTGDTDKNDVPILTNKLVRVQDVATSVASVRVSTVRLTSVRMNFRANDLRETCPRANVLLSNDPRAEDLRANELRVNDPRETYLRANDLVRFSTRVVFPFVVRFPSLAFSRTTATPTRGFIPTSAPG